MSNQVTYIHQIHNYIFNNYIFIIKPAPIVELRDTFFINVPLAPEGLAF